ncbi:hypothetical protein RFI_00883 [Reticulomyxa filosa]|uniref:2Fe-2S ferredoxin n=1 Tax=Reticulomyxa filosa TaxID=46433 RepID=X6PDJ4_RETFI|nr:hypothetical protein RFI_00883 [Reticulomyxa filosa]|eukprot:ETO36178.1 hypothetical protein RFI_00883 [Reticulomyxa filosa]
MFQKMLMRNKIWSLLVTNQMSYQLRKTKFHTFGIWKKSCQNFQQNPIKCSIRHNSAKPGPDTTNTADTKKKVTIHWITPENENITTQVPVGLSILEAAHSNDIELEGACEASLACSTCHVILEPNIYDKLKQPTDDEYDMLDLAFGLTETSRLGCQIIIDESFDGTTITLPKATRNFAVDGYKPKPH